MPALPVVLESRVARRDGSLVRPLVALCIWSIVAASAWAWLGRHEDGALAGVSSLLAALEGRAFAPLALAGAFLVRPATLLPVTVLTAFCGFLFGPVLGFVLASVAVVSTSLIPYGVTRLVRGRSVIEGPSGWRATLARRPFESVLTARLAMVPGDVVNVAAGLLRVPVAAFVAATAIGGAPGLLVGVLAGAGLQGAFRVEGASVGWPLVLASAAVLGVSLAVARFLRRRGHPAPG
jgi:uncharacterized membrane protein YdjX (TVP38/TMEM64 family)